ncbi:MAG: hypothetical protein BWX71_02154 [Deltaproteobacteria bacterium ADurb.Bin072]|nr:MAG: hypothetical protein BWX71_02154 [Deltaproteobacteria bacterium ADurb.Bin072]
MRPARALGPAFSSSGPSWAGFSFLGRSRVLKLNAPSLFRMMEIFGSSSTTALTSICFFRSGRSATFTLAALSERKSPWENALSSAMRRPVIFAPSPERMVRSISSKSTCRSVTAFIRSRMAGLCLFRSTAKGSTARIMTTKPMMIPAPMAIFFMRDPPFNWGQSRFSQASYGSAYSVGLDQCKYLLLDESQFIVILNVLSISQGA